MCTSNYQKAVISFNIAYDLKRKRYPSNHPELGVTLNNFGNYYKALGNMNKALKYYNKALKCQNDQMNNAITILNIGIIHMKNGHYRQAEDFCINARQIFHQIEPCPYAEIIFCQGILGEILFLQQAYIEAKHFYLTAFELSKKHLHIGHIHLIHSIEALADLYEKLDGNNKRALEFCFEQLSIHKEYLSDQNHFSIAVIQMKIGQLLNDKTFYEKALIIFEKNLHQHYESTSNCLIILAKFYQNEQALSLYSKANEIQRKIYPLKHPSILNSQQMINNLTKDKTHLPIEKINIQHHSSNVYSQQLTEPPIDNNVLPLTNIFTDESSSDNSEYFQTLDSNQNERNIHMNSIEDKFKEQKSKPIDNEHITISCNRFLEKTNVVNEDIIQGVPKVRRKIKCE
jgi:tetratricopeptide (TPR) repeat protein